MTLRWSKSAPQADAAASHLGVSVHARDAAGQPFHITNGWVTSSDLKAGYVLATPDGRRVVVVDVRTRHSSLAFFT